MITRRRAFAVAVGGAGLAVATMAGRPGGAAAGSTLPAASPWSSGLGSKMRLVRGAPLGDKDGFAAAIEISLEPGFKTYWRMPGDTGVPPLFDWSGSRNLASIAPVWPVPRRFEEAGVSSIGYDGGSVVLPLRIAAADLALPVELQVSLVYAACKAICVPEKADASLPLRQDAPPGLYTALIEAAAREVPRRIEASGLGLDQPQATTLSLAAGNRGLTLRPMLDQDEHILDLFVEGPERWLFGAPRRSPDVKATDEIALPLVDRPKWVDRAADIPFTLTMLTNLRAVETMIVTRPVG